MIPRWLKWIMISVTVIIVITIMAAFYADEPVRRYAEQTANEALDGYSLQIGTLALHPLTLSMEMRDVIVRQEDDPDAPMITVPRTEIDARIAPLLAGKAAVDIRFDDPVVSVTRQQIDASLRESGTTGRTDDVAWQDQVLDMFPFDASLVITNGNVTYTGDPAAEPIHVTALEVVVRHLTNRPTDTAEYPTDVRIGTQLLDHAEVEIVGRADPLAKPFPAARFSVRVDQLETGRTLEVAGLTDLPIKSGTVSAAGHLEYSPTERAVTIDRLHLIRPRIEYVNQQDASKSDPQDGDMAATVSTWQERALALFPVSIREVAIDDGTILYRHTPKTDPIRVSSLNVSVQDIRNVTSKAGELPSPVHVRMQLGEQGRLEIDGRGDLFSKPIPSIETRVRLNELRLLDVAPLASVYGVQIKDGRFEMDGRVQHVKQTVITVESFLLERGKLDYVYRSQTREKPRHQGRQRTSRSASAPQNPAVVFRTGHGKILSSEVGFIDRTTTPGYRVFMADLNADMDNVSNRIEEGSGAVKVTGKFMGSGPTVIRGTFRPEKPTPDFDLAVTIIKTDVTALKDVLRANDILHPHTGTFAFFSELTVKNNQIEGYAKPLLRDVEVYDPNKDQDKALSRRIYRRVVDGAMTVLENRPRDEVATKTDITGELDDPEFSTWQIIGNLFQNAFFKAILPSFADNP
jgi:hypothetical protein